MKLTINRRIGKYNFILERVENCASVLKIASKASLSSLCWFVRASNV